MSKKITIRKAKLTDSEFLLKILIEAVNRKFINSLKVDKKNINVWNQWLKQKLKSEKFIIFIGKNKFQKEFGYVSFDEIIKNVFEVRIGNLPRFYGKGFGSLMLSKSIIKFLKLFKPKKIISIVKKNNIRSSKCFIKNGFKRKKINFTKHLNLKKINLKKDDYFEFIKKNKI